MDRGQFMRVVAAHAQKPGATTTDEKLAAAIHDTFGVYAASPEKLKAFETALARHGLAVVERRGPLKLFLTACHHTSTERGLANEARRRVRAA